MNPQTLVFLDITGHDGAVDGEWFQVKRNGQDTIRINISLRAGTATWKVQGRNDQNDEAHDLDTGSADKATAVARFAQMRVILTASTGGSVRATGESPMREVEIFPV